MNVFNQRIFYFTFATQIGCPQKIKEIGIFENVRGHIGIDLHHFGRKQSDYPVVSFYGAEQLPNGHHAHVAVWDDGSNVNTELINPADGAKVKMKYEGTFIQGCMPYTRRVTVGNICGETGMNAEILKLAKENPDRTASFSLFCTRTPDDPEFVSLWPERLPKSYFMELWRRSEAEFRRSFMGQALTPDQLTYKRFIVAVTSMASNAPQNTSLLARLKVSMAAAGIVHIPFDADRPRTFPGAKVLGFDPGFTGEGARQKAGRSMSGACILGHHETGRNMVLFAEQKYLAAGEHEDYVAELMGQYGFGDIVLEVVAAQSLLVQPFRKLGLRVHEYNPSAQREAEKGGVDKRRRKLLLATAVNRGALVFPGMWQIETHKQFTYGLRGWPWLKEFVGHLREHPATCYDDHDAAEMAYWWMAERFGLWYPQDNKAQAIVVAHNRIERPWMAPKPTPEANDRAIVDEMFPETTVAEMAMFN